MTFASVLARRRASRVFAVMPMMISISVVMTIPIAMSGRRRRSTFLGVFEVRRIHAFGRMRTRLVVFESADVAEFLAAIRLRALEILSAGRHSGLRIFAGIETETFRQRGVVVFRVRPPAKTKGKRQWLSMKKYIKHKMYNSTPEFSHQVLSNLGC